MRTQLTQISQRLFHHCAYGAIAVVAAFVKRGRHVEQPPKQVERLGGLARRDMIDDRAALRLDVLHKGAVLVPVDEGAGFCDGGQPLAHFGGHTCATFGEARQFQPQAPLRHRIARNELEQNVR